jgi:hypothetical protein
MTNLERTRQFAPAQTLADALTGAIMEATGEKLDALLRIRREILNDQRIEAYAYAFARLQARLPVIPKSGLVEIRNKSGGVVGHYNFAKFSDMYKALQPMLAEEGFSVRFDTENGPGGFITLCELMHEAGFWRVSRTPPLPADTSGAKNAVQAVGSSSSYGRRYALMYALNLAVEGEDDDAVSIQRKISAAQVSEIAALIEAANVTTTSFQEWAGYSDLSEILERDYARLCNRLKDRSQRTPNPNPPT